MHKFFFSLVATNLEYRAGERQRKRESRRQASEAQREKGRQRSRARDKKQRSHFFVGEQNKNFVATVTKWEMLVACTNENERAVKKKLNENTHNVRHFLQKTCNQELSGSFTL